LLALPPKKLPKTFLEAFFNLCVERPNLSIIGALKIKREIEPPAEN